MAIRLSETERAEFKHAFNVYDKNGNGSICTAELREIMAEIGESTEESFLEAKIAKVDADGSGTLNFEEFVRFTLSMRAQKIAASRPDLVELFKKMDVNKDGFISAVELRRTMESMGEKLTSSEVENMMREADIDSDGKVNYEEFLLVMG